MGLKLGLLILSVVAHEPSALDVFPRPRVPPTAAAIAQPIANNKGQLTNCYERARSRDDTVVGGTILVTLSLTWSGAVRSMKLATSPSSLRVLEPCFRQAISRWAFPPSPRAYRTEFPVVFQSLCTMSISSVPWSEVWMDGQDTGRHTPFVDDHMACGEHKLTLKRPDLQIERTESIALRAGQRFQQRYTLAHPR